MDEGRWRPAGSGGLEYAIRLREAGELEEARAVLLELHEKDSEDPAVNYQCAWVHDRMGRERAAVPFYERAISNGLSGTDLEGAVLSLGSSHRVLGEYERAVRVLRDGTSLFPENRAMRVFLAMALYNVAGHREATALLLHAVAETSSDVEVRAYGEAISFYADRLDDTV